MGIDASDKLRRRPIEATAAVSAVRTDRCKERVEAVFDAARDSCEGLRTSQEPGLEELELCVVFCLDWLGDGVGVKFVASESRTRLRRYETGALETSEGR